MKDNDYLLPGLAAILLSVLFPVYWIQEIISGLSGGGAAYFSSVGQLTLSSWVFLGMGALSIYVYYCFKRILHDQLNFKSIDILLWLMIISSACFFGGLFLFDALPQATGSSDLLLTIGYVLGIGFMVIFGLIDITIGIMLLRHFETLPSILKVFSIVSLIQGILEISIIFNFGVLLSFPIYLILLAVYFLRKPDMIEVV